MALNTSTGASQGGDTPPPEAAKVPQENAPQGVNAISRDMDAELAKLKEANERAKDPITDKVVDQLDAALEGIRVPKGQQLYSFTNAAHPNTTFWVYPNAVELKGRDFAGKITTQQDDPLPMEIQFYQGRYTTNDERMAKLIEYHMLAWPDTYGSIQSGMGSITGLQSRIKTLRDNAATQMSLGGLGNTNNDEAILNSAERMMQADNLKGAERMILAVENLHAARTDSSVSA